MTMSLLETKLKTRKVQQHMQRELVILSALL